MSDNTLIIPKPRTDAEYQAAIEQILNDMQRDEERMNNNSVASERLKAEMQTVKAHTDTIMTHLLEQIELMTKAA